MNSNIFIPKKIKVGYNKRKDTYTKKLAYVIYYDEKGKLRKETSWENWRSKDIEPDDFENSPTEGFVLNKNVGGYAYHWDARKSYIRIFDPRGFEFEITLPNLLYILENTSSIKGKGLEGQFVYGWEGKELVLVPVNAPEYTEMQKMTNTLYEGNSIKPSDLKVGYTYLTAKGERYVYMGRSPEYTYRSITQSYNDYLGYFNAELKKHPEAKRYKNSHYKEYKYPINKGNKYWLFSLNGKYTYVETRSGISKKFYAVEGDKPHKHYAKMYEYLNSRDDYCLIDFDKVTYEQTSYEDWLKKAEEELKINDTTTNYRRHMRYYTVKNGNKALVYVSYSPVDGLGYYVEDAITYYGRTAQNYRKITFEELYKNYPEINITEYLTNGNKLDRKWCYTDEFEE